MCVEGSKPSSLPLQLQDMFIILPSGCLHAHGFWETSLGIRNNRTIHIHAQDLGGHTNISKFFPKLHTSSYSEQQYIMIIVSNITKIYYCLL